MVTTARCETFKAVLIKIQAFWDTTLWSTVQILNIKTSPQDVGNYLPIDKASSHRRLESSVTTMFRQSWILHVDVDRLLLSTLYKEKVSEPTLKSSSKNSLDWQ